MYRDRYVEYALTNFFNWVYAHPFFHKYFIALKRKNKRKLCLYTYEYNTREYIKRKGMLSREKYY